MHAEKERSAVSHLIRLRPNTVARLMKHQLPGETLPQTVNRVIEQTSELVADLSAERESLNDIDNPTNETVNRVAALDRLLDRFGGA